MNDFELFLGNEKIMSGSFAKSTFSVGDIEEAIKKLPKYKSPKYVKLTSEYAEKLKNDNPKVNIEYQDSFGYSGAFTGIPVVIDDTVKDYEFVYDDLK
jgi:hypothetical protein